jgi:hypoxia up-regulated 1
MPRRNGLLVTGKYIVCTRRFIEVTRRGSLRALDNLEVSRQLREEAHNTLEGYLYKLRDLLDDGAETPFTKCSQQSERKALSKKLSETIAWLHDEGDTADTVKLWEKRSALE